MIIDRTADAGKKFGRLTVLGWIAGTKRIPASYRCRCDCGAELSVRTAAVLSGKAQSCGCLHRAVVATSGGDSKRGSEYRWLYSFWVSVRYRTTNPDNPGYAYYADRKPVDAEWQDYNLFKAKFVEVFTEKYGRTCPHAGESLDRIDNNSPYSLDNLRFATDRIQVRNRRNTRSVLDNSGKLVSIAEIWDSYGQATCPKYENFSFRYVKGGWELWRALGLPESIADLDKYPVYYSQQTLSAGHSQIR